MQLKTQNPDFKSRIRKFLERQYFMKHIGLELTVIGEGHTEAELQIKKEHHQQQTGLLHGGVISTAADVVMGFAAVSLVPADHFVVTGELKVSYLNPGVGDKLHAKGWVIKAGRKIHFCEAELFDGTKLIAKASSSMVIIPPETREKD